MVPGSHSAHDFLGRLETLRSPEELQKYKRYFKTGPGEYGEGDVFMGVRMGQVFALAKEFADMDLAGIETLLDEPFHEPRAGAVRIMATQARGKRTPDTQRRALYELYLRRHDRINDWDLVDLGAWDVVGRWLVDKPRDVLDELARSSNMWERRTAILATMAFIRERRGRRHVPDRGGPPQGRPGPDPQGRRVGAASGRRQRPCSTANIPRSPRDDDASDRASVCPRALR